MLRKPGEVEGGVWESVQESGIVGTSVLKHERQDKRVEEEKSVGGGAGERADNCVCVPACVCVSALKGIVRQSKQVGKDEVSEDNEERKWWD